MIDRLNDEIKNAMKAKNQIRVTTLRSLLSESKNIAINNNRKDVYADDIITAVSKGLKQRKESVDSYISAGREDLANIEKQEIDILSEFQPKQLTELDIIAIVDDVIATLGLSNKSDMGKIMGAVMQKVEKGSADGKLISKIVGSKLN